MDVSQAIRTLRAVRQFKPEPLPEDVARNILNAGRRAQSSKNTQPWRFIAVNDRQVLDQLSRTGKYTGHLAGAAMAVVILTPVPQNESTQVRWLMFDAGQAAAYMMLAAWELGVGAALAAIYEPDLARQILGFPPEWRADAMLSFGYPADPTALTRPLKKGGRQTFDEVVSWNHWQG